ncbi:MAG: hypothetical protein ABIQ97_03080 [Lysobacteraceae bacterium]
MTRRFIAVFLAFAFAASNPTHASDKVLDMYSGKARTRDEVAVIYNPGRFIQKIDREVLYKSPQIDPNDLVDSMRVLPGSHTIHGMLYAEPIRYSRPPIYKETKFKFGIKTEAGHTYYIYFELVSGQPALGARDLGENFEPVVKSHPQGRTPAQITKNDSYYEQLKTSGVDYPIELVH